MRRADRSSRGVLPTVVHRFVLFRNLKNEVAVAHVGTQHDRKKKIVIEYNLLSLVCPECSVLCFKTVQIR
jgi:hypothetical protein